MERSNVCFCSQIKELTLSTSCQSTVLTELSSTENLPNVLRLLLDQQQCQLTINTAEFTDMSFLSAHLLSLLKIPVRSIEGTQWSQCMTEVTVLLYLLTASYVSFLKFNYNFSFASNVEFKCF